MTDPKALPPEVQRHIDRQRKHQAEPIHPDRPTAEELARQAKIAADRRRTEQKES